MFRKIIGVAGLTTLIYFPVNAGAVTLPEAVQQALSTNPRILSEVNEVLAREQEIEQARAGYFPVVDVNAAIGLQRADNAAANALGYDQGRDMTRKEAGVTLDQMLFDGFATKSEVDRQKARTKSQKFRVTGFSENVALAAVESYLSVLRHKRLLELSATNLDAHQRVFDQVSLRSESGVGSSADLDQINGRKAGVSASLLADEVNLRDAETNYLNIIGNLPRDLEDVPDDIPVPANRAEAVEKAVANHPTLYSANADVEATLAQNRAAKNNYYPKLNFEVGARWGEDEDGVHGSEDDLTAMLRLRYNLYNGGRDKARNKQTAYLINEAKDVRDSTYRQVVESMRLSWSAYQATKIQLPYLEDHVVSVKKTRESYAKQFNLGKRTLLDLLDNENEVYQSERKFTDAWYDSLLSQYRILVAQGALLKTLNLSEPVPGEDAEPYRVAFAENSVDTALDDVIAPLVAGLSASALPETPAEPTEPETSDMDSAISDLVFAWKSAWESQNINDYYNFYAADFTPENGMSLDEWRAFREQRIMGASWIKIDLESLTVNASMDSATATFVQVYEANNYKDVVEKTLSLKAVDGSWLITSEVANAL